MEVELLISGDHCFERKGLLDKLLRIAREPRGKFRVRQNRFDLLLQLGTGELGTGQLGRGPKDFILVERKLSGAGQRSTVLP